MEKIKIILGLVVLMFTFYNCTNNNTCTTIPSGNYYNYSHQGCGGGYIYNKLTIDTSSYITISIDRQALNLDVTEKTFSVVNNPSIILKIEKVNTSIHNFCSDALSPDFQILNTWTSTSGQIKLRLIHDNLCNNEYVISIDLIGTSFIDSASNTINLPDTKIDSVYVHQYEW